MSEQRPPGLARAEQVVREFYADWEARTDTAPRHANTMDLLNATHDLARAYLAEHPADDDEAITEDWIQSLVPECQGRLNIEYYVRDGGRVDIGSVNGCDIVPSITFKTRGQLRRLIAALTT